MTGNQSKPWHPNRKHYRCSRHENLTGVQRKLRCTPCGVRTAKVGVRRTPAPGGAAPVHGALPAAPVSDYNAAVSL